MRVAPLILLAACYRSPPEQGGSTLVNTNAASGPEGLTMTAHGVGPLDATTMATLVELRRRLVGFEVRPVNDGSLQYDIYRNGERLAYVVPDDQSGYVFNIHAVSSQVTIASHAWRVGSRFRGASRLTACECWGPSPTCFVEGEHIALSFDRDCEGLTDVTDRTAFRVLDGLKIQRVIWSPTPFGEASGEDMD